MGRPTEDHIRKQLEAVVRPIVEGQIRGFIKEHPSILFGVNWYKPRKDKSLTLTNSLSKRIVRDLTCAETSARIVAALLESSSWRAASSDVQPPSASKRPRLAFFLAWAGRPMFRVKQ